MSKWKYFLPEVTALTEEALGVAEGFLAGDPRSLNILRHYAKEAEEGHMSLPRAAERAAGDIKGENYFNQKGA